MNALVLWIPGTLLVILGAILLALGRLGGEVALAVIGAGVALETVGTLLWIGQRRSTTREAKQAAATRRARAIRSA